MAHDDHDNVQQNGQLSPLVVVVEDIPSHEIYSLLVGMTQQQITSRQQQQRQSTTTNVKNETYAVGVARIADEDDDQQLQAMTNRAAFRYSYSKSLQMQQSLPILHLGPSNKGFKLLTNMGWKEQDGGLGKHRQGILAPIPTVLKKGKSGLGATTTSSRYDTTSRCAHPSMGMTKTRRDGAEKGKQLGTTKSERRKLKVVDQNEAWREVKRIRLSLRTDIDDNYEGLYKQLC